jgi:hypothetical protein
MSDDKTLKLDPINKPLTGAAWERLKAEWRDDAAQRPLHEKGVRYEDAEFTGTMRDTAVPPRFEGKPPNHGTYQVWREGKIHSLDVESVSVHDVVELTEQPVAWWVSNPAVTVITDAQRPTKLGDVIVDPTCGAWEVQEDGYLAVDPPAPVAESMEREGIVPQHIQLLQESIKDERSVLDGQSYDRQLDESARQGGLRQQDPEKGRDR